MAKKSDPSPADILRAKIKNERLNAIEAENQRKTVFRAEEEERKRAKERKQEEILNEQQRYISSAGLHEIPQILRKIDTILDNRFILGSLSLKVLFLHFKLQVHSVFFDDDQKCEKFMRAFKKHINVAIVEKISPLGLIIRNIRSTICLNIPDVNKFYSIDLDSNISGEVPELWSGQDLVSQNKLFGYIHICFELGLKEIFDTVQQQNRCIIS